MYEIFVTNPAIKDLRKLDAPIAKRIDKRIQSLRNDPRPAGCKKLTNEGDRIRIRVGDYRVIYEVSDESKTVNISRVRNRRDVYENM